MFNCTPVFYANYQATEKILINQGGTSSSKTYSLVQLLYYKAITEPKQVITITGESIPNLKKGAYRDAEGIYGNTPELMPYILSWNKTDRIIYFKNGSIIEFVSNLDEQSAKNGKRDYLFVNEANGISWLIFFQLAIRTRKQIYIDYNPSAPFWAHENLIGHSKDNDLSATVKLIISDHRHNVFLTAEEHEKIEGIKDKELWQVYARGKTGNLTGIIYPSWKKIKESQYPWDAPFIGGLDFGETNDPTAGTRIAIVGDNVYCHEVCYTPGLAPIEIKQIFNAAGFGKNNRIYCDHYPENIAQLRRLGVAAIPARKGQGSINAGITLINKTYNVFYTDTSSNIEMERTKYMWEKDPVTGKLTNKPIDEYNHLMDGIRYGVFTHTFTGR